MWYTDWFSSKYYLEIYRHRDDKDARDLLNLIQRSVHLTIGSKALDICCGAGRHSLELARRGFNVTGFDLSKYLISEAKTSLKQSKERNLKVRFLIKDMRSFDFKGSFDLAVNVFTSFGYFEDDDENFKVVENAYRSVKKGGYFVFDYINKRYLEENIVPRSRNKFEDQVVVQKRSIVNDFVIKEIIIKEKNKEQRFKEILKLYSASALKKRFEDIGFKVVHSFGDYYGNVFSNTDSKRVILVAQKR